MPKTHSKKVQRVINYIAAGKDYKRWRFLACFLDSSATDRDVQENPQWINAKNEVERKEKAVELIAKLAAKGFKAKVWAPLERHKSSGHTHVVVLSTFREYCEICKIPYKRRQHDVEKP